MREILARLICVATVLAVLGLSWLFAVRHNPTTESRAVAQTSAGATASGLQLERGKAVYDKHGCAACHAIAGRGNPRHPLDEVGARRSAEELRRFITATGEAERSLGSAVVARKARYREIPEEQMQALIGYLASLRAGP